MVLVTRFKGRQGISTLFESILEHSSGFLMYSELFLPGFFVFSYLVVLLSLGSQLERISYF